MMAALQCPSHRSVPPKLCFRPGRLVRPTQAVQDRHRELRPPANRMERKTFDPSPNSGIRDEMEHQAPLRKGNRQLAQPMHADPGSQAAPPRPTSLSLSLGTCNARSPLQHSGVPSATEEPGGVNRPQAHPWARNKQAAKDRALRSSPQHTSGSQSPAGARTESKKARLSRAFQAVRSVGNQPGLFLCLSLATTAMTAMTTAPAITHPMTGTPPSCSDERTGEPTWPTAMTFAPGAGSASATSPPSQAGREPGQPRQQRPWHSWQNETSKSPLTRSRRPTVKPYRGKRLRITRVIRPYFRHCDEACRSGCPSGSCRHVPWRPHERLAAIVE